MIKSSAILMDLMRGSVLFTVFTLRIRPLDAADPWHCNLQPEFPDGFHIDGLWRMHDRLTWLTCRVLDCFYQSLFDTRR